MAARGGGVVVTGGVIRAPPISADDVQSYSLNIVHANVILTRSADEGRVGPECVVWLVWRIPLLGW
jgi:hypothetical protein